MQVVSLGCSMCIKDFALRRYWIKDVAFVAVQEVYKLISNNL